MLAVDEISGPVVAAQPTRGPAPAPALGLVYRELPISEWSLLKTVPPWNERPAPNPDAARVIVAQDQLTGAILAYWLVFTAIHVEPVWIAPEHRHRPSVVRNLWNSVKRLLSSIDCNLAFCTVNYDAPYMNASMAQRLGFSRLPTDLYFLDLTQLKKEG